MRRTDDTTKSHFMTYFKDSGYCSAPDNATLYMAKLMKIMADDIEKMTNIPQLKDGRGYIAHGFSFKQHGFQPLGFKYENRMVSLYLKIYSDHRGSEQPSEFMEDDEYSKNRLYFNIEVIRDKYEWTHKLSGHWYMDRETMYSPLHETKWGLLSDIPTGDKTVWTEGLDKCYKGEWTRLPVRPNQKRFI